MKTTRQILAAFVISLPAIHAETAEAEGLVASDFVTEDLVNVDTGSGEPTRVGPLVPMLTGLAWDKNTDTHYGIQSSSGGPSDGLYIIDPATGQTTLVGSTETNLGSTDLGLAYDPNANILYLSDTSTRRLYTVSTSTAQLTPAPNPYNISNITGLAFDWNTDTLYGANPDDRKLYTIDPKTGLATEVGLMDVSAGGLAFDGTNLYLAAGSCLYIVDKDTGALTEIGCVDDDAIGYKGLAATSAQAPPPPCPLASLLDRNDLPFPLASELTPRSLNVLRAFRDRVLKQTPAGQRMVKLYYQHGGEVLRIMLANPKLAAETLRLIADSLPTLREASREGHDGPLIVSASLRRRADALIARFAPLAGDQLTQDLLTVRAFIADATTTEKQSPRIASLGLARELSTFLITMTLASFALCRIFATRLGRVS